MPFITSVFSEYDMTCDKCGACEVLHDVDWCEGERVTSHNCLRIAGFHRSHGLILCDKCFKERRKL